MCNRSAIRTMTVELQITLKIDVNNLYCKVKLVWLDSSLSVACNTWLCVIQNAMYSGYCNKNSMVSTVFR